MQQVIERFGTVVVRTDFSDEEGWRATFEQLRQAPDGWDDREVEMVVVDDPSWEGATPDEVLEVVRGDSYLDEYLDLVVLVDRQTVVSEEHLVNVVTAFDPDDELYGEVVEFGREFRSLPQKIHTISANIGIANMDFEEYARAAAQAPDGVYR